MRLRLFFLAGLALIGASLLRAQLPTPIAPHNAPPGLTARAFTPRSGPRGPTLFSVRPNAETGLLTENRYADPQMWWERYQEFSVGAIGTGLAIGDYDGDGRPDIFVVSKTESCRLFRNLGDFKFTDVTAQAGVGDQGATAAIWKQGATFVDVNNDGRLDIYLCRLGAPNRLYINQGDGTFTEEAAARGLAISDASGMAAFADYDRDGWLDVYLQTNLLDTATHPHGQRDRLFHNQGDGTFAEVTDRAGITGETQGHSATWWDYDNDGWPDLYVANDFAAPDTLYHNNRNGTFTNTLNHVLPHTPFSSMGADLGDVNNDGLIDLLVSDMAATTHEKDQRGMATSRAAASATQDHPATAPQYLRNALFLNTNTEHVQEAASLTGLAATDWSWSVRWEDLDNDGRLDLHVTNGMVRELHNTDILARMMVAESPAERIRLMRASPVLAENNLAFRNLGNLRFEPIGPAWGLDQKGVSFGAAFGDLDGDGDLDLVYTNYQGGVTTLRNDSDTGHRAIFSLRGTASNRFGVGTTLRLETETGVQVRQLVLARGYLSSSEPILHFGLGSASLIKRLTVSWPSGQSQIFTDLPADQHFTLTEPLALPQSVAALTESAAPSVGQFIEVSAAANLSWPSREADVQETAQQPLLPFRHNRSGPSLAVGDLHGNGRDDVIIGGTTLDPARVLPNGGDGKYLPASELPPYPALNDGPLLIFDANGDGANDLLITKGGVRWPAGAAEYQPQLWWGNHQGGFQPAPADTLPPFHSSTGAAAAGDFNRDGALDLFLGGRLVPGQYPQPGNSALLVNHGGKFVDVTDALVPGLRTIGLVTSALWTDVDGDGWPDLLLALEWGPITYFHNQQGQGFENWTTRADFSAAGTGWWNSLAAADFNGDGRLDYIAGNLGLNTPYHASPTQPALLYYGNFKAGGGPQIIEAHYEADQLRPWRAYKQLSAAQPSIRKRFPQVNNYAKATLPDLLGAASLAAAPRLVATEFMSGVFLSQLDGQYRFFPLPRPAQIAPLQGIVAGDFTGDGHADIYAVQNSYAPVPAIGHFDGGLSQMLSGDGHGHFTAVAPAASGLVVPGDAKALVVLDLNQDGWPDFMVSRNNGTTLAFRNQGVAARHSLGVTLRGRVGNLQALGAWVTLELADGTTQLSEVAGGSGYLSQSTATIFFGFPAATPPRRIRVRWPTGATSAHLVPEKCFTLTLHEPAP